VPPTRVTVPPDLPVLPPLLLDDELLLDEPPHAARATAEASPSATAASDFLRVFMYAILLRVLRCAPI
jgi:hypothetical protein